MVRDMPDDTRRRDPAVQSVDRAVSILELLAKAGMAGVTEIAGELGISKSAAFRLLTTLEARGLVEQDSERGKYAIGYTAVLLAAGSARVRSIAKMSHAVCQQLALEVGETVNVAVPDGTEVLTVDQALGDAAVMAIDWVGKRQPLHATAVGKVFLASMPRDRIAEFLREPLTAHTPETITDPGELAAQLDQVRDVGYATTYEEYEIGLAAVAMPIRDLTEQVVAAITISGPAFRVNERSVPGLLEPLASAAATISWRAGHVKHG